MKKRVLLFILLACLGGTAQAALDLTLNLTVKASVPQNAQIQLYDTSGKPSTTAFVVLQPGQDATLQACVAVNTYSGGYQLTMSNLSNPQSGFVLFDNSGNKAAFTVKYGSYTMSPNVQLSGLSTTAKNIDACNASNKVTLFIHLPPTEFNKLNAGKTKETVLMLTVAPT